MSAALVLVAGSLHLDTVVRAPRLPALDETLPGEAVAYLCGGKGGNQAVAASRHGAPTAFAGAVGDDAAGRTLLANLEAAGVDCAQVAVLAGMASGMSVAIQTASGEYGAVIVSAANRAVDAERIVLPLDARVLVLQNEVPEAVNRRFAAKAQAAGLTVLLNAAPARDFDAALMDTVDLLVVNRVEAEAMRGHAIPTPAKAVEAAHALSAGRRHAVVTLGAGGAAFATREGEAGHAAGHEVAVISTHGAGDVFVGALAARLADGDGLTRALAYAQAAAALHVSLPPAAPVTRETVLAIMERRV